MKKIETNDDSKYKFICIEPQDIEGVNIGGILALPKEGIKTDKLLTMIQFDKCKSSMKSPETGDLREVKTIEDAARRVILNENIDEAINGLGVEGQIILLPLLPNEKRLEQTLEDSQTSFTMDALQRECFTQLDKNNLYYRLDNQISKMIQTVINTYRLDSKTNFFGHSAMGLPAMRFAMLHPEQIDNLIIGGNADEIPTPVGENARQLKYPFGTQDFEELFNEEFNEEAFKQIAFRFYIGEYEYIDPNLDGIRDDNYGIRMDGKPGTGERFAPKEIADTYKSIYNHEYQGDINTSTYERLENVLEQYEKNGLDLRFLIYPQDCHSPIRSEDLRNAQFENGTNFEKGGSKSVGKLLENTKELEKYAQKATSKIAAIYQQTSYKIMHGKEEGDRENRSQALKGLAKEYEANRESNLLTAETIQILANNREILMEKENAAEAIKNLDIKENEPEKEEQK